MNTSLRWVLFVLILLLSIPVGSNTIFPVLIVDGDSMLPTYRPGDIVLIHNHPPQKIKDLIGKAIVFLDYSSGRIIIHRVIAIDGEYVKTQGDNNITADAFEPKANNILGIVYAQLK